MNGCVWSFFFRPTSAQHYRAAGLRVVTRILVRMMTDVASLVMVTVSICAASWHCRCGLKSAVRVHHERHTPTPPRVTCSFSNQTLTHRQGTLKSDLGKVRPCKIPQILTLFPFFLPFIIRESVQQSVLFVSHMTLDHRCFTHVSMCFKSTLCRQNWKNSKLPDT